MQKTAQTDFLFAQPSFASGVASVLDLGGVLPAYNQSNSPAEADFTALASDWDVIGQDVQDALHNAILAL